MPHFITLNSIGSAKISNSNAHRDYLIPAQEARCEIEVVNSLFIASLAPVFSVEQAKAFIARVRAEFPDASHHVPAYLIGHGNSVIAHCSDDGEPSGTAGRPALAVLQGSGLGDVIVVVTRYFGGTKLGTGGLVRAYSDAIRQVLAQVVLAQKTLTHVVMVGLPYRLLEQVRRLVAATQGYILDEGFGVEVTLTARFAVDHLQAFQEVLQELTSGTLQAEIIETEEILLPIENRPAPYKE
jgi:uncharacterized YigZ family protein